MALAATKVWMMSVNGRWLRLFPAAGYAVSQILLLVVLVAMFSDPGLLWGMYLSGASWVFLFIFLPAFLPSLLIGVLAGLSYLPTRPTRAALARIGASALVTTLGAGTAGLGLLTSFSVTAQPITLGEYLGSFAGMEVTLGLSWGVSLLTKRFFEKRHRSRGEEA